MKKRTKKIKKTITIAATIIFVVLIVFLSYNFIFKSKNDNPIVTDAPNNSTPNTQPSEPIIEIPDNKTKAPNTDHPAAIEPNKKQVEMVASVDRSNGTLFIRGGVNYPVNGGNCFAELAGPSSESIRKDSIALSNPNSTDCKTISIPVSDLAPGEWTFTLNYVSDEYIGVSSDVSFNI